jgi:outer membrane lipoprotein SlyB
MSQVSFQDLRRIADALAGLRGRVITDAVMRSDLRQLRVETEDGQMMVLTLETDEAGRPRLEVDVVRQPVEPGRQLEVRFDAS